jgi:hypothetical protein
MIEEQKWIINKRKIPVKLNYAGGKIVISAPYNKTLVAEIKVMSGAKWHGFDDPPVKAWSVNDCPRNHFQFAYLRGENPYASYKQPLVEVGDVSRPLYKHQVQMLAYGLSRKRCVWACEMGTGKTLSVIELIERLGLKDDEVWYVGPKSGIMAVRREFVKWGAKVTPLMMTYERMVSTLKDWEGGGAPKMVIFDESSKLKTPTAQRTKTAMHLADAVRKEHDGWVILMSGTPAPKSPVDYWSQCEIACPGFLREGTVGAFRNRLAIMAQGENPMSGVTFQKIVAWKDSENRCEVCGQEKEHFDHTENDMFGGAGHKFVPCVNEVAYLYKRMSGLVLVTFKKDCLDLPEKQYQEIIIPPTEEMIRTANIITKTSPTTIMALTLLRELSDGFQYIKEVTSEEPCGFCEGAGHRKHPGTGEDDYCEVCSGTGTRRTYGAATELVGSPKDEAFTDQLDLHEDIGRFIVWGGFTGTLDRLVEIAHKQGWATLRVDGRGYDGRDHNNESLSTDELLDAMDASHPKRKELEEKYPRLCFIGHPQAGGMALTLTASPTELFYSNSFNGEARMQAEDRFHRAGMDTNRGATIIDLLCLPTDKLVLDNLKKKRKLQSISLGELTEAINTGAR